MLLLIIALIVSWKISDIHIPTNVGRLTAGAGFVTTTLLFALAILNRISALFKIKSVGFFFMFLMFLSIKTIIDPLVWTTGLLFIPLLIDDIVFKPIWLNIWYNQYDGVVTIKP